MTAIKPMTGEQLDELMTVAVNFQRDSEKAGERSCANFAYAVQVAVLDLRRTREIATALAAENASLKEGIGFFSYDSSGSYEEHDTAEKAAAYAEDSISDYRDNAPDGWSDEVGSVVWGVILQRAKMVNERPVTEEDAVSPGIETWCDFALLPKIETPSTDAFLAEVRASALEGLAKKKRDDKLSLHPDTFALGSVIAALDMQVNELEDLAAQLRQDANTAELVAAGIITRVESVGGKCE